MTTMEFNICCRNSFCKRWKTYYAFDNRNVLESITRDTVIYIAKNILGIEVEERKIDRTELYMCDESFLCGSAMEITPVISVDKYEINSGVQGKITKELHLKYLELVTGNLKVDKDWLTTIY